MPDSLSLTAFERCMLMDDHEDYPRLCFTRAHFCGQLDRKCFESALIATLKDHVLFRALVIGKLRPRWQIKPPDLPPIRWIAGPKGRDFPPAQPLDLSRETGLRLVIVQDAEDVEITFQFHHACCDGLGMTRFFEDLICNYHATCEGQDPTEFESRVDSHWLKQRGRYGLTFRKALTVLPKQIVGLLGAIQFAARSPLPIEGRSLAEAASTFPASVSARLSRDETIAVRKAVRNSGASQNEFFAAQFFHAIWQWQINEGVHKKDAWVRLMIPMNMRHEDWQRSPAMNSVTSIFLDRRARQYAESGSLLQTIRDEMATIHRFDLRYTFLISLAIMNWIPGLLRYSQRKQARTASAVFTNSGKLLRRCRLPRTNGLIQAGNLTLLDTDGLAPIRSNMSLSLCVHEYSNRLKFNLQFDPKSIDREAASDILNTLRQRILKS